MRETLDYTVTREDEDFVNSNSQKETDGRKVDHRNYTIEAMDPYGFWYIKGPKGTLPEILMGAYTSVDKARVAVDHYLANRKTRPTAKQKYDDRIKEEAELDDNDLSRDSNGD